MSMGGLAVAIGLVIDDAVVVVENIHRRHRDGRRPRATSSTRRSELVAPVVGSTLTTVVVFAPLGLLSGVVGQFFRALSLTLSVAVLISLVLSLTLIPLLARASRPCAGATAAEDRRGRQHDDTAAGSSACTLGTLPSFLRRPCSALVVARRCSRRRRCCSTPRSAPASCPRPTRAASSSTTSRRPAWRSRRPTRGCRRSRRSSSETPEVATFSRRTGSELGLFATQQNSGDILVRLKPRGERDAIGRRDHRRPARQARRGRAGHRDRVRAAAAGHARRPRRHADADRGQGLRRRSGQCSSELSEQIERSSRRFDGVVDVVGMQRGSPEVTWQIDPVGGRRASA